MSTTTPAPTQPHTWQDTTVHIEDRHRAGELVTGEFAKVLLDAAAVPPSTPQDLVVLDNACGSGIVTAILLGRMSEEQKRRTKVLCGDIQSEVVKYVTERIEREKWEGVEVKLLDAQDTKLPSSTYTHVLTSFGIMLLPKPILALQEIHRILAPGGLNAFSTWVEVGWVAWVERAFRAIPNCPPFPTQEQISNFMDTGRWDQESFICQVLEEQRFVDVRIQVHKEAGKIESPEFLVRVFGSMFIGLATRWWTDEQKKEYADEIAPVLLSQLQEEFGKGQQVTMPMCANLITCRKPAA
ncbi:S-adenosyl-L-methionine-dependent methyltransferase [Dacryopinax primogenitus]|uniref:S-adenosyl-L-methionine-dependent methyltransferase n=1 Tax=Dacryopinax primogenitus (strain DJM 731) TaxID=1858805 RepID=M5FYZ2_DACPD|nr:S-adenosyl-L-methionine-dependent methyltransferase [Dacryopinax primogenitus]EJU03266.1 S-adenosyl-L-methionine-dependent methyltransferase [Dacryopinax primogenitus]